MPILDSLHSLGLKMDQITHLKKISILIVIAYLRL